MMSRDACGLEEALGSPLSSRRVGGGRRLCMGRAEDGEGCQNAAGGGGGGRLLREAGPRKRSQTLTLGERL